MKVIFYAGKNILIVKLVLFALVLFPSAINAQFQTRWMSVGSIHNWYSEVGSELEEGRFSGASQQDGLQWPAIYKFQDMQAARGLWIGAKDFTDENGESYPFKVVTCGPRNPAFFPFYPVEFKMISKFEAPLVSVDGNLSYDKDAQIDDIDFSMKWDREIYNVVNTQLGLTMTRKIFQFSQKYHDNYIVYDYTFTNTGNVNGDSKIEISNQTLTGVYFYFNYRNAVNKQARYVIDNSVGWGRNSMNDARGDGVLPDPQGEHFRAQFTWHGYATVKEVGYDNIGAPIWAINNNSKPFLNDGDTVGRLGATQFVGIVTLHADKSAEDSTDDFGQPSTTYYEDSDQGLYLAGANAFNKDLMTREYALMTKGHANPRQAYAVEPSGDFALQRGAPDLGKTAGGFSFVNGYGPYTIKHGESVHIVMAESAGGMSYEDQVKYGKQFKQGIITAEEKDRRVIEGRDSLFQNFRNALENYNSDYNIPAPPRPPKTFDVNSGGDRISLAWTVDAADPVPITGFRIYRAQKSVDSTYHLIHEAGPTETSYDDKSPIRGVDYYYYIVAVGEDQPGGVETPAGKLTSGRYYNQTYDPARLQRQAGTELSKIRIVPNPYNISASTDNVRFPGDRIAFYNIPGQCIIKIYTELGELIKTIEHTNGSGDAYWEQVTSSNQIVVSGIYIAVITDNSTGEKHIAKFAIIR